MSFDKPQLPSIPAAPTPPPVLGSAPAQKKPQAKSMQASFLGTDASPSTGQMGGKTLLGQ